MFSDRQFCVVLTSMLTIFAVVFFARFSPEFFAWTGWPMCDKTCNVQEWMSATAGWFSGIAAVVAAILLFGQLSEQKRQTAFTVGDAPPTMDAIEHLQVKSELVVRIVNWNRRGIVVRDVRAPNLDVWTMPNRLTIDTQDIAIDLISTNIPPFSIKGWEDRSKGPHFAELRLAAMTATNRSIALHEDWAKVPKVIASVQILGSEHRVIELVADTRPIVG